MVVALLHRATIKMVHFLRKMHRGVVLQSSGARTSTDRGGPPLLRTAPGSATGDHRW